MHEQLREAVRERLLRPLDAHFAGFLRDLGDGADPAVETAACLASQQLGEGHICVDLADYAGRSLFADPAAGVMGLTAPDLDDWLAALRKSPVVQSPGGLAPLVLDGTRLYLRRYWCFEQRLAARLTGLAAGDAAVDEDLLRDGLNRLFGAPPAETDWQRVAAAVAVLQPLAIISGGPGTGKTHTVSRVLALLAEQYSANGRLPRIRLAAPTGKAAARLTESIQANLPGADDVLAPEIIDAIPREAMTLHRLLRARPDRVQFGHDADNPLHLDVLLVDEASMVDLPLMARVADALPPRARLILLGDKDQLSSVEAGAVLGDLCSGAAGYSPDMRTRLESVTGHRVETGAPETPLADGIAFLYRSYRFRDDDGGQPGIGSLARAIRNGNGPGAVALLRRAEASAAEALDFRAIPPTGLPDALDAAAVPHYRAMQACAEVATALAALNDFRILCAVRDGPFGARTVNRIMRERLAPGGQPRWYHGQPVMIASNDYALGLYNGDIGLVWGTDQGLRAHFPDAEGGIRHFAPQRLPAHDTVYAMTVHKSQGSEFDRLIMILPDEPSPVLTRELVYTGVTRAKSKVMIWGNMDTLREAIEHRPTRRASGLVEALRQS